MSDQNERRVTHRRETQDSARRREHELRSRTDILCRDVGSEPQGLARAQEELRRLDRIAERDPLRRFPDFRPEGHSRWKGSRSGIMRKPSQAVTRGRAWTRAPVGSSAGRCESARRIARRGSLTHNEPSNRTDALR